jgi:cob(I)alamin adenosyltransferase
MKIYTKTGDKGETGLADGTRISKNSSIIAAIGSLDEANSFLGTIGDCQNIQEDLMTISSILAGAKIKFYSIKTKNLEKKIDAMEKELPKLKQFILPGGNEVGAKLFFARTLVRKAERSVIGLNNLPDNVLTFLNRLSDYLFVLARYINFKERIKETPWRG